LIESSNDQLVADTFGDQLLFAQGLARCSQALLEPVGEEEEKTLVLKAGLEHLRQATRSSRAFLYRNFDDPELGFCSRAVAVAYDPQYHPDFSESWLLQKIPWSIAPEHAWRSLESGQPFGGVVQEVFGTKPDFLQALNEDGVLSVQFFPVHIQGEWWGYIGFDDRQRERRWTETEITLLGTAAELFANALQRWQTEAALERRSNYEKALARCSRVLHQVVQSEEEQVSVLNQGLGYLRSAVDAGRAYLFENFLDPELGLCTGMRAEVCAPGVHPQIGNPANQRWPWSKLPDEMRQAIEAGKSYGGPTDEAFASIPLLVQNFKQQQPPLLSVQTFPIHFGDLWWGFIGYDDVEKPRQWSPEEVRILRIASEMIGNTIQRWQTEANLRIELDERRRREVRLRLLESVVVNTSEGVIITEGQPIDPPGPRILYVNEAFTKTTGYTAEEIIGQSPRILQGPQTSRQDLNQLRGALERQEEVEIELINYRKDGSQFWVEMSIAPIFDDDGNCTHFIAVQRDVTKRKRAEEALRDARDKLEVRVAERTSDLARTNKQLRQEIANRLQAEAEVKQRLAVEQALADISTRLVKEADIRAILPAVLHDVAKMVDARRVALVFLEEGGSQVGDITEWYSPDTPPLESIFSSNPVPSFSWMRQQLEDDQTIFLENLDQMPASAAAERQIIQEMGTDSIATIPIHVDGQLAAALVCSNFVKQDSKIAQQLDILNVISGMLGNTLQREALLNSLEQRAIDRTRELAAFYDMTMLAGEVENLSDILEPTLEHIMMLAHCQAVSIHELSADGTSLHLVAQQGLEQEKGVQVEMPLDGLSKWFESLNEPIIENRLAESKRLPATLRLEGYEVYLGAQLRAQGKALGILSCYRQIDRPYSLNTTALVVALAEQLGIIIENYRLRRQAEQGVIIEERQRLARDLHDAITQSLYGVTLFARSGVDALEEGSFEKAAETLQEVEQNALHALKEMRLLLHQLQPLALEKGGLRQAIDGRLNQVERRLGIEATLTIADGLILRPRAKETVYRIITEALNNSLKHADASEVSVTLHESQGHIRLEVHDNGCGFDPDSVNSGMGIKNMRERSVMLQGELTLTSIPEGGTTMCVDLPVEWLE
jgi:PAS domain S-box-containing protein